ncbi:hypothetical protein BCR39DRAFT_533360 [Naematelia encephala]|uniref:Uncharacterized protein n=1 Tax=Naematelia encephala TaxID=71784 RepID=A0A1Y2B2K7_9TREE|nr:hypothetical protein BCR39DRAFT_533360 [Naematelia encephala]
MAALELGKSAFGTDALEIASLFDISGWVVVVTGGGTGIGLCTATALAANGAKVYISGRRLEPLQAAARDAKPRRGGGQIIPVQADISTKEGILKLKSEVEKEEKWINVLVNNAGVSLKGPNIEAADQTALGLSTAMFEEEEFEKWSEMHRINTAAPYFLTSALLPLLSAAQTVGNYPEPGNVVNVASLSGITRTSQRGQFSYNSSKAATRSLSEMLAYEFAHRGLGIRVNCINPGYFPSGMSPKDLETKQGPEKAEYLRTKHGIPFGRVGNARDYAQCILGLITNQYMTGTEVLLDGGWLLESAF